jgi:hypothetical protein
MLRVRVFDKNKLLADAELGAAMAAVAGFRDGQQRTVDVPLVGGLPTPPWPSATPKLSCRASCPMYSSSFADLAALWQPRREHSFNTGGLIGSAATKGSKRQPHLEAFTNCLLTLLTPHAARPRPLPGAALPPGANGQGSVTLTVTFLPFDTPAAAAEALVDAAVADEGPPVTPGAALLEAAAAAGGPGAAVAAADAKEAGAQGEAEDAGPAVGEAVEMVSRSAVEAIEDAAQKLEGQLKAAGVDGKVSVCVLGGFFLLR